MRTTRSNRQWTRAAALTAVVCLAGLTAASGQTIIYSRGQNVAPAFEGWEQNPDGSFNLVFGYMNRNMDEMLHIPVGPGNRLEPGPADQGQPTYFLPRRNRYVFRVRVPYDFGEREVVWTLTAHGRTEKAYASLRPDYVIDDLLRMKDIGGLGVRAIERRNRAPAVRVEGPAARTVRVGEPLALTAVASDDGIPEPKPAAPRTAGQLQRVGAARGVVRLSGRRRRGVVRARAVQGLHRLSRQLALVTRLGAAAGAGGRQVPRHRHVRRARHVRAARDGP